MTVRAEEQYTVAEYLRVEARKGEKYEFFNGKIKPMAGASISHNRIARNILTELDILFKGSSSFEAFGSDQKIYLPAYHFYVYPDAVVVSGAPVQSEADAQAIINPILIIEVLSPSTEQYDRDNKFTLYRSLPTLQEYVLLRQDQPQLVRFFREAPDLWRESEVRGLAESVPLQSVQASLALSLIYRKIEFPEAR